MWLRAWVMGKIKSRVEFLRLGTIMIMLPGLIRLDMLPNEYDLVAKGLV